MRDLQCIWPIEATLGEGPCWHKGSLWFVDIAAQLIHRYEAHTGVKQTRTSPYRRPNRIKTNELA